VRQNAVREAGHAGEMDLLARHLTIEHDESVRETILTNMMRIGGTGTAHLLVNLLRSEDPVLRNAVIETLQYMGDTIIPEIERLLSDPDSDVRIFAVNILQSLRSPRVAELALRVIASDPHINVCAAAIDILAEVGQPHMASALHNVLERFPNQPFLAFAVCSTLQRIG
jgi:HEAT repeat protein